MERCCVAPHSRRRWLTAFGFLAVFLAVAVIGPVRAADPQAATRDFHTEAGDARTALNKFSEQSQLMLLFDSQGLQGTKTAAVEGSYAPIEALRQLLQGTDLVFAWVNDRTLAITHQAPG